ncbi:hypothetical protein IHE45_16G043700 [Dioscorea alata]|uniref:Uncharacterized protein n=1 Tax=Dioscorea alata TaxID=55571 RepID=A0ACB7UH79_DIOAL|nr:hypothetical protein IHE45_16G043700 [Dioscorea alata]
MAALLRAPHPSPLAGARLHASRSPIVNSPLLHSISSSTPTGKISTSRRTLLVPLHASTNPSPPSSNNGGSMDARRIIIRTGKILSLAFPLWISLAGFLGLCKPSLFLWVHRDWQILGLTLTMLGIPPFIDSFSLIVMSCRYEHDLDA